MIIFYNFLIFEENFIANYNLFKKKIFFLLLKLGIACAAFYILQFGVI